MSWISLSAHSLATFFILSLTVVENGRLSVYADTWERTLCHHAEDGANVRVFSVPLTGDAFDFDHDDYLLEKYCRLSNPAWVADLQALADQINEAIPDCIVPAIYRIM